MGYDQFGWENAPEGWSPGDPAPEGSEDAQQTAARMEAFGEHVHDGAVEEAAAELAAHTGDTIAAHAATAISVTPAGGIAASTVAGALAELDTEKQAVSAKGQANGYASLGSDGLVPDAQLPAAQSGSGLTLIDLAGNMGASKTIATAGDSVHADGGILNANCAITLTGKPAGQPRWIKISGVQDATGGRTITVDGEAVSIPSDANAAWEVIVDWSGSTSYIYFPGGSGIQGPPGATGATGPTGPTGATGPSGGGMTNPMTTAGDVIVGGASGTPTRVAKGSNNTTFGVDGSGTLGFKADAAGGGGSGATGYCGDGSDGAVTIAGTVTLTRDMLYDTLLVPTGTVLVTGGFRVLCKTSCQIDSGGTVRHNGANASGFTAALGAATNALPGGGNSGAGAAGAGAAGTTRGSSLGGAGGAGGTGSGGAAGAGGAATAPTAAQGVARALPQAFTATTSAAGTSAQGIAPGAGGGSGSGDGSAASGAGGGGGGYVLLAAKALTHNGAIEAKGGNGGNAGGGNAAGGGGGGGGLIVIIAGTKTGSGTASVAGGTAGSSSGTGTAATAGSAGTVLEFIG